MRRTAVAGSLLLAACSFKSTGIDPGGDRGDDALAVDAPADDGPPIDAPPIDALVIDAPSIDAPPIDALVIDAPPPCPVGYVAGYRYISTHSTWLAAEQDCENDQPGRTHLVVIGDAAEGGMLSGILTPNPLVEQALWIGVVRDPNPSGDAPPWTWRAVTGGPAPYTPWSPGQPDNAGGGQYVVRADKTTGQFFDRPATDATLPALCECDGRPPVNADHDPLTP